MATDAVKRWNQMNSLPGSERFICIFTTSSEGSVDEVEKKVYYHLKDKHLQENVGFTQRVYEYNMILGHMMEGESFLEYIKKNRSMTEKLVRKLFLQLTLLMDYLHDTGYTNNPFYLMERTLLDDDLNIKFIFITNCFAGRFQFKLKSLKRLHLSMMAKVLYVMITGDYEPGEFPYDIRKIEVSDVEQLTASPLCRQLMTELITEEVTTTEEILDHIWMMQNLSSS